MDQFADWSADGKARKYGPESADYFTDRTHRPVLDTFEALILFHGGVDGCRSYQILLETSRVRKGLVSKLSVMANSRSPLAIFVRRS